LRDWLYVEDHASAMLEVRAGEPGGPCYKLRNNETANIEVANSFAACSTELRWIAFARLHRRIISFVDRTDRATTQNAIDASKITRKLGWAAGGNVRDGMRRPVPLVPGKPCVGERSAPTFIKGEFARFSRTLNERSLL